MQYLGSPQTLWPCLLPSPGDFAADEVLCLLQLAHNIQALASKGDFTFAAVGTRIVACKRAHRCFPRMQERKHFMPKFPKCLQECQQCLHPNSLAASLDAAYLSPPVEVLLW